MTVVSQSERAAIRALAHKLADAASAAILPLFRQDLLADNKDAAGYDPVTRADRAAEHAMREILRRERPDDGIIGEEFGAHQGSSEYVWVLDPIDGTRAFLCGAPSWGILIAFQSPEGPEFGLICQPWTGERFEGGWEAAKLDSPHGETVLSTRAYGGLSSARLMTTFPEIGTPDEAAAFARVRDRVQLTRYGMDCYAYALLASGQIDLVIEAGLQPYDVAAPIAVIEGAGGIVTDWIGGPAHDGGQILAAANADIHADAMAALKG